MSIVIYRLSNIYLSCIYRICNVVDSGRIEEFRGRHGVPTGRSQASYCLEFRGRKNEYIRDNEQRKRTSAAWGLRLWKIIDSY